ncbi:motile sperm domain-containing protein 1-like [Erpetoichthys calabaricus]|uniref:Motile sperm domain-containing protein 3 n=1 Tax=Erpetoichthys calabaricus TaxID=27687 RepID=A0A8C4S359_ERPCA|nr:motile sperm domain-containing protein 1-like [Erpetoichthys calabaricus]
MSQTTQRGGKWRDLDHSLGRTARSEVTTTGFENPAGTAPQGKLPIFLFPAELTFYAEDQTSHKQVLTLYNPYGFIVKFKILSTAPARYTVADAEGYVKPNSCIDIVIRHKDISARHYGVVDKFRMDVFEEERRVVLGRKEILSILQPGRKAISTGQKEQLRKELQGWSPAHMLPPQQGRAPSPAFFVLYVMVGLTCVTVLMLPLHEEKSTLVPQYLHVTVMQKLVCAYILGLLTMVFLR